MTTELSTIEERLAKLPAIGSLPSSEGMASLHLADVVALTGRLPKGCESPRAMFISWPVELSRQEMVEMWRGIGDLSFADVKWPARLEYAECVEVWRKVEQAVAQGVTEAEIAALYLDRQVDLERHQYQFQQVKESNYPDYSDPHFRVNDLRRRMAELRRQIASLDQSISTGTETVVAYGNEIPRKLSPAGRGRLGNLRVNYETLYMEMEAQLAELEGRGKKSQTPDAQELSEAEAELNAWANKMGSVTIIHNTQNNLIVQGTGEAESTLPAGGARNTRNALPMSDTSPTPT